jgi:CelD/BcsL family acetyltransferase involved in cellulose biosynthesis
LSDRTPQANSISEEPRENAVGVVPDPLSEGSRAIRVEWITDWTEIRQLREPWLALSDRIQRRTVYSDHDWILAWYEHYAHTDDSDSGVPLVGVAWEGEQLVGVAPLLIAHASFAKVPVRRINFAGYNLQAGEFLALDGRPGIPAAFIQSLASRTDWDVISVTCLQPDWPEISTMQAVARERGLLSEIDADDRYAVADLREGYQSYLMKCSGHFRQNLKRYGRKIDKAGGWKLDRLDLRPSEAAVEEFIRRVIAIADTGWRVERSGIEIEKRHQPFYERIIRDFAPRGMVDLCILRIGDRDAAYCMGLLERNAFFHVLMGFDNELRSLSPGVIMLQERFRLMPEDSISRVLSHGDYDYKKHWVTAYVSQQKLVIFNANFRARLSHFSQYRLRAWLNRVTGSRRRS